jgi:quercetin dioxygenase-like cupin family protein
MMVVPASLLVLSSMAMAAPALDIVRPGQRPAAKGSSENFTGDVSIDLRFQRDPPARVGGATVAFQPGARTAWHKHPLGQTLIVTSGTGWVQRDGAPRQTIRAGDVVWIPAEVKHWHGATADSAMTHVAITESLNGQVVAWLEHVSDGQYRSSGVKHED